MLESILSVQPKTGTGSGKSREEVITDIANFVQSKTPAVLPIHEIQKKYPTLNTCQVISGNNRKCQEMPGKVISNVPL